ncbi:hypothetical protein H2248_008754 [Termitomyces sp. 'cryptogamus']|nr:hypothetical protein H2248_008754 [Termitomyces sp. 'cryptogamus']
MRKASLPPRSADGRGSSIAGIMTPPPPAVPTDGPISAQEFNSLRNSHTELHARWFENFSHGRHQLLLPTSLPVGTFVPPIVRNLDR